MRGSICRARPFPLSCRLTIVLPSSVYRLVGIVIVVDSNTLGLSLGRRFVMVMLVGSLADGASLAAAAKVFIDSVR